MKMKKALGLLLAGTMVLSLVACGGSGDGGSSDGGDSKEEAKSDGGSTLKVAAVETAYGASMWEKVCEAFEASHDGVTVELTIDKKLEDVIDPDMKAGNFPDVILRAVGGEKALTETFVKDNNLTELTDVLDMTVPGEDVKVGDKILPGFTENTIVNPYGDGKTYLMPMFYGPCGLFYNAALLKEKGWEVPETWDEMWELGDKAKAEGIALFTYPTTGYFDAFFYALLHEALGEENFAKALKYEEGIWNTPEAQQVFDVIAKLASYTEKTTPANANDNDFQKNQQLVLDNKAIFMPNGNWVIGEMAEAPRAEGFEWGFTALPAVEEGGERASYSFFEQVWMPKEAVNVDLGKEFIAYLYSDEAAEIFATEGGAVQPIAGMTDKLSGDAVTYYQIYDTGAVAVLDAFATTEPVEGLTTRGAFFDPVNSLVTGDKTQEQWVKEFAEASDAFRGALKE
ncbi:carbohydrate ABC transporter substrate-binding protein [Mediterraneibacter agrestimuris]|uniref:carbohydrate ABC transporter substrate-binding protein n=1 Tax=Mediterraneibacter agrestimuris TaxID=2941333 RepID=UPI00203AF367|nr:carbohydrate ABC transporter substrate-binding protein [Mediterraneibacter agrestimuris]